MTAAAAVYREPLLKTPFHSRVAAACRMNRWSRWAGYATVDCYWNLELEYFAIRNSTTLFDLSPMMKYRVAGPDAERYLNRLLTRDVGKVRPGRVAYSLWCNDAGHVLDDGTLFRFSETEFRLCSQERHLPWLLDSALGYRVEIEDVSEALAALALQGPTSCAVLKRLGLSGIAELRPFALSEFDFEGRRLLVSRTGFTGDLGYELWVAPELAETLWDRLMEAGGQHGIRPIGSAALNLARIEAGFLQPQADFVPADEALRPSRGRSPFELGLERLVDFDKGHFNGRRALLAERERGTSRYRVVGLDIEGNRPAEGAFVYHDRSHEAGHVTSAMWSPTCKRNLAIATLRSEYRSSIRLWVEIYVMKELKWEKRWARAHIVRRPFFDPERRRATPAGDF